MNTARKRWQQDETGLVAIMVTVILMMVISLIVIGFSQITRRNQREVLDRQLSTQAFYAAESGINDVRNLIKTAGAPPAKTDCPNTGSYYSSLDPDVDTTTNVAYTCVLVNPTPSRLEFNRIDNTASTITKIRSADSGDPAASITLDWQPNTGVASPLTGCPTSPSNVFSSTTTWTCGYGVLRLDLVPTDTPFTSDSLQQSTMTMFVVPQAGSPTPVKTVAYQAVASNTQTLTNVGCDISHCLLTINGLAGRGEYYLRISSIYRGVPLQIDGLTASGQKLEFEGAQVVIDSTGRAQDVLRRIQVHVSTGTGSDRNKNPDNAIGSFGPVCKRFSVTGGYFVNDLGGIPASVQTDPQADRLCRP